MQDVSERPVAGKRASIFMSDLKENDKLRKRERKRHTTISAEQYHQSLYLILYGSDCTHRRVDSVNQLAFFEDVLTQSRSKTRSFWMFARKHSLLDLRINLSATVSVSKNRHPTAVIPFRILQSVGAA